MATVALDVLRGLEYMHSHGMLHRDVKVGRHPQSAPAAQPCPPTAADGSTVLHSSTCAACCPGQSMHVHPGGVTAPSPGNKR